MVQRTLNGRIYLMAALALLWVARPTTAEQNRFAAEGHDRPNILILISDDQAWSAMGYIGNANVKTPNIDRLAQQGTTFRHTFNMGAWNGAVCIASRAMVMTGRHVWQAGGGDCGDYTLWPTVLGSAGYETYVTGKWHNGGQALRRGFKHIGPTGPGMYPSTNVNAQAYHRPKPGNDWDPVDPKWKGHWLDRDGKVVHSSEFWADNAIGFLNGIGSKSDNPFFMYVAFHAPHDPRQAPQEYLDMYPPKDMLIPPNYMDKHPFDQGALKIRDEILAPIPRTKEIVQVHLQEYYAIITHMDDQIGRILDTLEKTGKAGNTIIIFTSDHGLAVGQHGLFGKQNLYEHSIRVPFIIAGPGIEKGQSHNAMIYMQNMFATTCEMAGIKPADTVQYPSIVPLITGEKESLHDAMYLAYTKTQRGLRTERYKYIEYPKISEVQLFDVKNDPFEINDLAEHPDYADKVKAFASQLQQRMADEKDPILSKAK